MFCKRPAGSFKEHSHQAASNAIVQIKRCRSNKFFHRIEADLQHLCHALRDVFDVR